MTSAVNCRPLKEPPCFTATVRHRLAMGGFYLAGAAPKSCNRAPSLAALNAELERLCLARLGEAAGRDRRPVGERLDADLAALMRLPAGPFEACDIVAARASSTALVRYRGGDYSVPTKIGRAHV